MAWTADHAATGERGTEIADSLAARAAGATCAVAGQVQRDLRAWARRYPRLLPDPPFDPAFFSTIALANTFCAPWLPPGQLQMVNRMTLWNFGLDRLVDHVASSTAELADITGRCLAVAGGADPAPADELAGFLAELRDQLAAQPSFGVLRPLWHDELSRTLACTSREWQWQAALAAGDRAGLPSLTEYLDNAEYGFSFIFVSHWIATAGDATITDVDELRRAGLAVQLVIRLLNDIGSEQRDLRWGDLNALNLATRDEVLRRTDELIGQARRLLAPLRERHRPLALFLERHIDFNSGFYPLTDYQAPVA